MTPDLTRFIDAMRAKPLPPQLLLLDEVPDYQLRCNQLYDRLLDQITRSFAVPAELPGTPSYSLIRPTKESS